MSIRYLRWVLVLISTFFLFTYSAQAQNIIGNKKSTSIDEPLDSDFNQLYLVFAGPYPASPSSAFGHLFLLVEPKGGDTSNPQLWRAINFAADVEGHSGISTLYNGLIGNLEGSFEHLPFYKKIRDYSYSEARDLWLFPIELTPKEKHRFANFINSRQDSTSQYRFSDKNCATYISKSLHYSFDEPFENKVFVLPQDVISDGFINQRLSTPLWIQDIEGQLGELVSKYELNNLANPNLDSLDATEKVHFLKTYEWLYNNRSIRFDAEKKELIRKLRYDIAQQETDYEFNQLESKEFDIHHPARIGVNYFYGDDSSNRLLVDTRLGLHGFSDKANTYPKYDYIDIFRIRAMVSRSEVLMDEFWIFHQSSRQPKSELNNPLSWSLGLGGDRFLYEGQSLMALGIYSAVGKSYSILDDLWSSSMILSANPTYLEKHTWSLIVNPKVENRIFVSQNVKGMVEVSNPIFLQSNEVFSPRLNFNGVYSITDNIYFTSEIEWQSKQVRVLGGINFNLSL